MRMITPEMIRDAALATVSTFPEISVGTSTGSRGKMITVTCDVTMHCNVKAAAAALASFTTAMRRALLDGTINCVKRNGAMSLRGGYFHMGQFCTERLTRTFYVAAYEGREADIDAALLGRGGKW